MVAKFHDDDTKYHVHLKLYKIRNSRDSKDFLKINGCMQLHMIRFSRNGNVTAKVNLCSCDACKECKFFEYLVENGLYLIENSDVDSDKDLDESQDFIEGEDIKNEQNELYEMRSDSVFDVIKKDGVIALYSPPNSLELFYLCKVKEFGIAQENLIDPLNHIIPKRSKFIKRQCFEKYKKCEERSCINYYQKLF